MSLVNAPFLNISNDKQNGGEGFKQNWNMRKLLFTQVIVALMETV